MKKFVVAVFLFLIFIASSWSLFNNGFFRVHDFTHAARIAEMARALQDGHFPVRWSSNFGYGYGMPLFEFYAPLPFYVGALFYLLGVDMILVLKLLFIICNLTTLLGAYKLGSKLFGRTGGLLTSSALTLAPYRAVNLFVRGALSEAWAIMALPWILLGIIKTIKKEKNGWLILTFSLIVLMLSHNITAMLFVPFSILFGFGYLLIYLKQKKLKFFSQIKTILTLAGSYLLALGVSAFYILPAFLEKGYTKVESFILGGYFDYHLHFLYIRQFFIPNWGYGGSSWGLDDDISFFLGGGQLGVLITIFFLLIFVLFSLFIRKQKTHPLHAIYLFSLFTLLTVATAYMSTLKSLSVWDLIPILTFVQFPWRFLSLVIVFLSLIVGSSCLLIKHQLFRVIYTWVFVLIIILSNFYFFRPEKYLDDPRSFYYTDASLIRSQMSSILPDYIPSKMAKEIEDSPAETLILNSTEKLDPSSYEVLVDRTDEKLIRTNFKEMQILDLSIADYPGWKIQIDDQSWTKKVSELGNLEIEVPAGERLVSVWLSDTSTRLASNLISLASILIIVGFFIKKKND